MRQRIERVAAVVVSVGCVAGAAWFIAANGGLTGEVASAQAAGHDMAAMNAPPLAAPPLAAPPLAAPPLAAPAPELVAAVAPASQPQKLFVPPLLQPRTEGDTKVFALTAQAGTITRFGETLDTAGYNGSYLAPTIRITRGDHVRIDVTNDLDEATTVHWHGLHVTSMYDGGPYQPIEPGQTLHPTFTVMQQATTLWYHPHLMGQTAAQVGRGMAGMLIVDDANPAFTKVPHRYGVDDFPLILQGAPLPVGGGDGSRRPLLVNGTPNAVQRVSATRVMLRIVNGTGGAILGVGVRGATAVRQVGSDGGLLPAPIAGGNVVLGPSERAELVVDMKPGAHVAMRSTILEDQGNGAAAAQAAFTRGVADPKDTGTVLTIVNTAKVARKLAPLPKRLNETPALDVTHAVERTMTLGPQIEINGMRMTDRDMEQGAAAPGTIRIPLGQTEIWTLNNISPFTHVFHVHDIEFQVLSRDGAQPPASERGWKDSIHVPPGHSVRIAMQFTDFADPDDPYMFHCHILRHEDGGMMGQFVVIPNG